VAGGEVGGRVIEGFGLLDWIGLGGGWMGGALEEDGIVLALLTLVE
jgi:hypothetical protein